MVERISIGLALLLLLLATPASGKPHVNRLTVDPTDALPLSGSLVHVMDPDHALAAEEIAANWRSMDWLRTPHRVPNLGLTSEPAWFAVQLTSPAHLERLLVVSYPPLDYLDVYLLRDGHIEQHYTSGDQLLFASRPLQHREFVFPLTFEADASYLLLLRVQTSGSLQLPAALWPANRFIEHTESSLALQAVFIGIMLALAAYHLLLFFAVRNPAYLWYVAFLGAFLLGQIALRGIGMQYLWPGSPAFNHHAIALLLSLGFACACMFTHSFLNVGRYSRVWSHTLLGLAGLGVLVVGMSLVLPYTTTLIALLLGSTIGSVLVFLCGCHLWARGNPLAPMFVVAWAMFLTGNVLFNLSKAGVLPSNALTEYLPQAGTVLQMLLLSFALALRINLEISRREQAQQRALSVQQEANEALESRVAERTGELQSAYAKLQTLSQLDSLTRLKNRAHFDQTLATEWARHRREQQSIALMLIDADHFKRINDQHGHLCGDACLRHLSALCQSHVQRAGDLVARYGGEEFVMLLPGTTLAGAAHIGEGLRKTIAEQVFAWQGQTIPLTVSVGVAACVPDHVLNSDWLLRHADEALYAAKAAGRDCTMLYQSTTGRPERHPAD